MAIPLALSAFVSAVLLHGLAARVPMRLDSVPRFLLVGVPVGVALLITALALFGPTIPGLAAIILYALLCEIYIFCFTLALLSVSATTLVMLREASADDAVLLQRARRMVDLRIERMVNAGLVQRQGAQLLVTAKGMKLHCAFTALRRFFVHGKLAA